MEDQEFDATEERKEKYNESKVVNIKPSEPNTDASNQHEENAPGRTPGKAEGSREIIEADLEKQ